MNSMNEFKTIVLDTNLLVSFLFWPNSIPGLAVKEAVRRNLKIITSQPTIDEFRLTLEKPKIRRLSSSPEFVKVGLQEFLDYAELLAVTANVADCRDPKDNMFLELALTGEADCIVTGDIDLLALHPWRNIEILTPRKFLDRLI